MRRARTTLSRAVVAFLALQVLSGWLILFAIAWCLLEIYRMPARERAGRRRPSRQPASVWYDLEVAPTRSRGARFVDEPARLAAAA